MNKKLFSNLAVSLLFVGLALPFTTSAQYNQTPQITALSQASGFVGTQVTVFGSGFSTYGNTVHFGNGVLTNITSSGNSLTFTVPQTLTPSCYVNGCLMSSQLVTSGNYSVSVTNANGNMSNALNFVVMGSTQNQVPLYISNISPTYSQIGTQVTISGTGFTPTGNAIDFGNSSGITNVSVYNGNTLTFTLPQYLETLCGTNPTRSCPSFAAIQLYPSTYQLSVIDANGSRSNGISFTVAPSYISGQQPYYPNPNTQYYTNDNNTPYYSNNNYYQNNNSYDQGYYGYNNYSNGYNTYPNYNYSNGYSQNPSDAQAQIIANLQAQIQNVQAQIQAILASRQQVYY